MIQELIDQNRICLSCGEKVTTSWESHQCKPSDSGGPMFCPNCGHKFLLLNGGNWKRRYDFAERSNGQFTNANLNCPNCKLSLYIVNLSNPVNDKFAFNTAHCIYCGSDVCDGFCNLAVKP